MPKTYIALDLETTGLDPMRDSIIEVGAMRFEGEEEIESFSTFVNPGRSVPHFVTELTGITDSDVADAPSIRQIIHGLREFVGSAPVVGHNIGFDLAFLRRHNALLTNAPIDTFELASLLVPHASRYSLENLINELGIEFPPQTHRALDDARMAHALFLELLQRAVQLPKVTLKEISRLGDNLNWGARFFFHEALRNRARQGFQGGIGAQIAARRGGDAAGPLFLQEAEFEPLEPRSTPIRLDLEELNDLFAEDGPLADVFDDYEPRPQQLAMMRAVAEAFNEGHHLLVEAGTGTGKSLAYLIPAVQWAIENDERVVISTNTINLQEQLAESDIPNLDDVTLTDFRAMVLKGRSHYLCRRQFQAFRRRGPSTEDELRVLARVLIWLPNTLDGDGDGLFLPTARDWAVWSRIAATAENCDIRDCPYFENGECFFYRARERAESAHLLVVNHALLLADVAAQNRVLPDYSYLIVDEAHHLEDAATESLHFSVDWNLLRYSLDELLQGHYPFPGLLAEVQGLAQRLPRETRVLIQDASVRLEDTASRTLRHFEDFFDAIAVFLDDNANAEKRSYTLRLRITDSLRTQPSWDAVELAWASLKEPLANLADGLRKFSGALEDLSAVTLPELEASRSRLTTVTRRFTETHIQLKRLIESSDQNTIYWLEKDHKREIISFHSVPLQIGPLVQEHLFDKKKSVILTSATLRIDGTFDYLREHLGALDAEELAVGSPFDYASAVLLYVVDHIPEPGQPGYQKEVSRALLELFQATEGRGLSLFTSYSQLKATAQAISGPLARCGITVYAQGGGSSRAQLLANFRKDEKSVLLGTRSFWEGVDIPGEALSCLAITKLPFDVPSDPVVSARSEVCDDPFNAYMVPEAILRFLQGFGRLIRTRTDRGVVVVLDRRILSKRYGPRFLDSLPDPTVRVGSAQQLPEMASLWLSGEPLPPTPEPLDDEPWSVPPPEEPSWWWGA